MANIQKKSTQTQALANFDEELAQYAQQESDREQTPAGNFIGTKSGILTVGGASVKDNKLLCVVVDSVYENHLYTKAYDPENKSGPTCFAFAREEGDLAPHPDSAEPQSETCASCPQNVYGTAVKQDGSQGKGKACKNIRRMALIPADNAGDEAAVKDSEVFYLKTPVTSTKNYAYYVKALAAATKKPPFAVTTEIALRPDAKNQFSVNFSPGDMLPAEVVRAVMAKREEIQEQLCAPYAKPSEEVAPPPPPAKTAKFAPRKK